MHQYDPSVPQELIDLIEQAAALDRQDATERSKPLDFFLTYDCPDGPVLDGMIASIIKEIEQWEQARPDKPRQHRRRLEADRRFKKAARVLILNALHARKLSYGVMLVQIAVSLDANSYGLKKRYAPPDITYDPFIEAFNGLLALNYLTVTHKGFFDPLQGGGWTTRIIASDRLADAYSQAKGASKITFVSRVNAKDKDELIILRDGDRKRLDYTDNKDTDRMRRNLKRINKVLAGHDISLDITKDEYVLLLKRLQTKRQRDMDAPLPYMDFSATRLYRIFSDGDFERGGRFYRAWWINTPKEYRKRITIDGHPTVELDYSRYHISMAYAELGKPLDFDPYDIFPAKSDIIIDITKKTVNALLNASSPINPVEDFKEKIVGMEWSAFVEQVMKAHSVMVDNNRFLTGYGLRLHYLDSCIAEAIMLHFAKQKIPCLPVHDSFIVVKEHKDELLEVMQSEYRSRFYSPIRIKQIDASGV